MDTASLDDARREVRAILNSGIFAPTSRQARLLEYLFQKVEDGHAAELKEFTVALELFHKTADFDSHTDATVRVEAHRLRKKIEKYYETIGRDSKLRVTLRAGQYVLHFEPAPRSGPTVAARPHRAWHMRKAVLWAAPIVVLLVLAGSQFARLTRPVISPPKHSPPASPAETSAAPDPEPGAVRILAGQTGDPYVDNAGRQWQSDRFFSGGAVRKVSHEVFFRTSRPQLFRLVREGTFHYRIPLSPGEYEARLYFTDPDVPGVELGPERRFRITTVYINGRVVCVFDLAAEIGCYADTRAFAHLRPDSDGILDILFQSSRGPAAVSAIEILPMVNGEIRPVRIIAQRRPFLDNKNRLWFPDDYYSGGNYGDFPATIDGDLDPGVVSLDRSGDFEYFIPVPDAEYQVYLYFGEAYHGPGHSGGGGVGSRVFDVLLNNEMVLRDYDILREAPPMRLVTRTFRHVRPDTRGKIHLTFSPKAHLASVRAIEILPEKSGALSAAK